MLVFPAIALAAIAALPLGTTAIGVSGVTSLVDAVSLNLTPTIPGASRPLRAPLQGVSTLLNYSIQLLPSATATMTKIITGAIQSGRILRISIGFTFKMLMAFATIVIRKLFRCPPWLNSRLAHSVGLTLVSTSRKCRSVEAFRHRSISTLRLLAVLSLPVIYRRLDFRARPAINPAGLSWPRQADGRLGVWESH